MVVGIIGYRICRSFVVGGPIIRALWDVEVEMGLRGRYTVVVVGGVWFWRLLQY